MTPPGEYPIQRIITARPFDTPYLPGVKKFYYRLQRVTSSYVQKSFFLWSINDPMLARLEALFYESEWAADGVLNPG